MVLAVPLRELQLISRIRRWSERNTPAGSRRRIPVGIGDDCSLLRIPRNHDALVTTDFSLEGVHFRRQWHPPESVGHRSLARGLSDIASMGGEPVAAFLSLALPRELSQASSASGSPAATLRNRARASSSTSPWSDGFREAKPYGARARGPEIEST